MPIALILCYPLLVHIGIMADFPYLRVCALVVLACAFFYKGLRQRQPLAWTLFLAVIVICILVSLLDITVYALYLPPIIIPALLFAIFTSTLLPHRTPLVTSIGEKARGPFSPAMRHYTYKVTLLWTVVFALMTIIGAVLPWVAPVAVWSLFTNLISYLFVGLLFFLEFIYRRYRYPEHDHPSFAKYIKIVIDAGIGK